MSLKIRQERIQKGWTQGFAARQIGMTKAAYRNIETGQRKPSYDVLIKLLDLFDYNDPRKLFAPAAKESEERKYVKLKLTPIGRDSWSRPVYSADGKLYVDTDPRKDCQPNICTKYNNSFDGEPCDPVAAEFEFIPYRDTWD